MRRSRSGLYRSWDEKSQRRLIIWLRLTALLITAFVLPLTWKAMLLLPWEADALIAVIAAMGWAYKFERP